MSKSTVYQNENGVRRTLIQEDDDPYGNFAVRTDFHVGGVIRLASDLREVNQHIGHRASKNMVPVAEIPMNVVEQWMRDGCLEDRSVVRKWINDPANRPFRITEGKF